MDIDMPRVQHKLGFTDLLVALSTALWFIPTYIAAEPLKVAYTEFPPYSFTNEAGAADGFSIDVIRRVLETAGHQPEFVHSTNPGHTLELLSSGGADLSTFMVTTPARLEEVLATQEVGSIKLAAFTLRTSGFARSEDLAGKRIGVVKGSASTSAARMIPFAEIVEFQQTDDLIVPLLLGEVDAVVSGQEAFTARLREANVFGKIITLEPSLVSMPYAILVSETHADLLLNLNQALDRSLSPATIKALRESWFGRDTYLYEKPAFWFVAIAIALFTAVTGYLGVRVLRYKREAARALRANQANDLLVNALDELNAAIVIYDQNMRAVHRNAGFAKSFPRLVPQVDAGATMADLIGVSYKAAVVEFGVNDKSIDEFVSDVIASVEAGMDNRRLVKAKNGLVYEARDFRLGADHYASIRVDVTAQAALQETIVQQAEELKLVNARLESFAAIAAHDLRSPLSRIAPLVEFIIEDLDEAKIQVPQQVEEYLGLLTQQADAMSTLVEDLLTYASAGTQNGRPESFDPCDRLANVLKIIEPPEGFTIKTPQAMPQIFADPIAFETVMRNLISNALKHHGKGVGTVEVFATENLGHVQIHVSDDGVGIPEKYQNTVFEPFKRLSSTVSGSGLGLAFVQKTVESWGGSISLSSSPGEGCTFSITVPRGQQVEHILAS
ncbi:transporter substrate-binding domain-containing protein [Tritonibacter mobilis]|nr:transporter substrate-binding domain-containing protein [Tritonibacter mobilis]